MQKKRKEKRASPEKKTLQTEMCIIDYKSFTNFTNILLILLIMFVGVTSFSPYF